MKRVNEGMSRRHLQMPSPAMIVALVALFVALTGGAFAAADGFKHGPKGIVNADDIAYNTITWREIKQRTLQTSNFSAGTIKALHGLKGAAGIPGARGPTGAAGVNGVNGQNGRDGVMKLIYRARGPLVNTKNSVQYAYVLCDTGYYALGGGANTDSGNQYLNASYPGDAGAAASSAGWVTWVGNNTAVDHNVTAWVICAPAASVGKTAASAPVRKSAGSARAMKPR